MESLTLEDQTAILGALAAVFAALTAGLIVLVRKGVRAFEKWSGTTLPASIGAGLEQFARMGAGYAEEAARKVLLGKQDGPKTGAEKLVMAVTTARSLAPDGLSTFSDEQVATAVEAQLPSIRPPMISQSFSLRPPKVPSV